MLRSFASLFCIDFGILQAFMRWACRLCGWFCGQNKEKITIMTDSAIGSFGIPGALILVIGLRILMLSSLPQQQKLLLV